MCVCVSQWKKVPDEWQARQATPAILQLSSSKHNAKKITTRVRGPFHQSITAILTGEKREEKQFTKPTCVSVSVSVSVGVSVCACVLAIQTRIRKTSPMEWRRSLTMVSSLLCTACNAHAIISTVWVSPVAEDDYLYISPYFVEIVIDVKWFYTFHHFSLLTFIFEFLPAPENGTTKKYDLRFTNICSD